MSCDKEIFRWDSNGGRLEIGWVRLFCDEWYESLKSIIKSLEQIIMSNFKRSGRRTCDVIKVFQCRSRC